MKLFESDNSNNEGANTYNAESIEVLKGLEPVKRRPGMYTDTSSPNHLAFEVIDNSVDEARMDPSHMHTIKVCFIRKKHGFQLVVSDS